MVNEFLETYKRILEFWIKLSNPRTYLQNITHEELLDFTFKLTSGVFKIWQINAEYLAKIYQKMMEGDPEEILKTQLDYISKLEDVVAETADSPVYSAYVNALNRAYINQLLLLQEFSNALFHSVGLPTRKDIVALSEAYVDLKGDIKREVREIKKELREVKRVLEGGK